MFTRYHWIGLLVPLLAILSTSLWTYFDLSPPIVSVVAGIVTAVVAYIFFTYVPLLTEPYPAGKAIVLGALVTEMLVFHGSRHVPAASSIALFLFLYLKSAEIGFGNNH